MYWTHLAECPVHEHSMRWILTMFTTSSSVVLQTSASCAQKPRALRNLCPTGTRLACTHIPLSSAFLRPLVRPRAGFRHRILGLTGQPSVIHWASLPCLWGQTSFHGAVQVRLPGAGLGVQTACPT